MIKNQNISKSFGYLRPVRADLGLWGGKTYKSGNHVSWSHKR